MTRSRRTRWINGGVMLALAVAMAVFSRGDGLFWGVVLPLLYAGAGLWASPIGDRATRTHAQVLDLPADHRPVVVYARPGCSWCLRLRLALLGRPQPTWVDIWDDDEAAAFVRSVNDGNETVPTVVIAGHPHTNPPPREVLRAVQSTAP